jgi:uncharacterized protein YlxW (UPF0749 family)
LLKKFLLRAAFKYRRFMQEVLLDELRANRQEIRELAAEQARLQSELDRLGASQKAMTNVIDAALLTIALEKEG